MLLGVSKRTLPIGRAAVLVLLLYTFVSNASGNVPPRFDAQDDDRSLVDLADGVVRAGGSSSGDSSADHHRDDEAYRKAVEAFARHYSDTIGRTDPLVHKMLMHSEGADTMTKVDIEELGDLLSDMGAAPHSEVVGSYPEGYEDCDGYLRSGAASLGLAAAAVRGFNESADMEYLRDYRRLIAMYMRAVADAQWCVSDHPHQAHP
jgi:hypothetical protein